MNEQGITRRSLVAGAAAATAADLWMTDSDLAKQYGGHIIDCGFVPFSVSDGGVAERIGLDMGGHIANGDAYWLTTEDIYTPLSCYEIGTRRQTLPEDRKQFWVVLNDESYRRHMGFLDHRVADGLAGTYAIVPDGEGDEETHNESDPTTMEHADTIEELAELMDPPFLVKQIEPYNQMVEEGENTQCGRFPENLAGFRPEDGPFHAGRVQGGYLGGRYLSGKE